MADTENLLIAKGIAEAEFIPLVEQKITKEFFLDPQHRGVFEWMQTHWGRYATCPTSQALSREFPNYPLPDTPEPMNYYLDEIRRQYGYETFSSALQASAQELEATRDPAKVVNIFSNALADVQRSTSELRDHDLTDPKRFSQRYEFYEELTKNPGELRGLPTGFASLDSATMGYQTTQLIVLAGPAKAGKSAVLLHSADAVCKAGNDVLLVSFEMTYEEQEARWLGMRAQINYRRLLKGKMTDNDRARLDMVSMVLNDDPDRPKFILSEDTTSTTTVSGIIAKIQQHKPKAVFIDGVYLMDDENGESKGSSQALTNITRSLKRVGQTFEIPIICTTQTLHSKMKGGTKVSASSVGYSSSFSQDADTLIGLEAEESDGVMTHRLKVLLSRSGPTTQVELDFDWSKSIITEIGFYGGYDDDEIEGRDD
jgi:replicative DNA helicase